MSEPKKLILTKEFRDYDMYTCPYCKIVGTPLSFTCNDPWCDTGYHCPLCHEDVLPNRKMKQKQL